MAIFSTNTRTNASTVPILTTVENTYTPGISKTNEFNGQTEETQCRYASYEIKRVITYLDASDPDGVFNQNDKKTLKFKYIFDLNDISVLYVIISEEIKRGSTVLSTKITKVRILVHEKGIFNANRTSYDNDNVLTGLGIYYALIMRPASDTDTAAHFESNPTKYLKNAGGFFSYKTTPKNLYTFLNNVFYTDALVTGSGISRKVDYIGVSKGYLINRLIEEVKSGFLNVYFVGNVFSPFTKDYVEYLNPIEHRPAIEPYYKEVQYFCRQRGLAGLKAFTNSDPKGICRFTSAQMIESDDTISSTEKLMIYNRFKKESDALTIAALDERNLRLGKFLYGLIVLWEVSLNPDASIVTGIKFKTGGSDPLAGDDENRFNNNRIISDLRQLITNPPYKIGSTINIEKIEIHGHTDDAGDTDDCHPDGTHKNEVLSQARADKIQAAISGFSGLSTLTIEAKGHGSAIPAVANVPKLACDATPEVKAAYKGTPENRRVEIKIIMKSNIC